MQIDESALRELGVELVVTFGSTARGTARPESDVDVGVVFGPWTQDPGGRLEAVRAALGGSDALDLVLLDGSDPLVMREAALDGRLLMEDHPGAFEEFRIRAFTMYMDTEWMRRVEADVLRRRAR